jgi:hypothetical protein
MQNPFISEKPKLIEESSLHLVVNQLIKGITPIAVSKNSFILNDIHPDLKVKTDVNMLAYIIGSMLNSSINIVENDCIHISAKIYSNIIIIQLKDNYSTFNNSIAYDLELLQPIAKKLGGTVCYEDHQNKGTSIAFSFTNA